MKLTARSKVSWVRRGTTLGIAVLAASPLACSTPTTDLPLDDMCASMGQDRYEFGRFSSGLGTFELEESDAIRSAPGNGMLIADDDDLTDDYGTYLEGTALYEELKGGYEAEIAIYEAIGDKPQSQWSEEENEAAEKLKELGAQLTEVCWNYPIRNNTPEAGVAPLFLSCKDNWNDPGDGVVGLVDLTREGGSDQDRRLAECTSTMTGEPNTRALNFWGPVTTRKTGWEDQELPYDGWTFSGVTIPISVAAYGRTDDLSAWEGVAFWARVATADEAIPLDGETIAQPLPRKNVSPQARPMDGAGQLGVIIQTLDTAAIDPGGRSKFYTDSPCSIVQDDGEVVAGPCFPTIEDFEAFPGPALEDTDNAGNVRTYKWALTDARGRPAHIPQPFCTDYSPVDFAPGEEAPFRNQCWDGFRWMLEITSEWKFYFIPFSQMRQAGWGQVADTFRIDQVRSVNFLTSPFQSANMMVDEVVLYRRK